MNIFRRLRWQLTFSYILVTVSAFLVVILALGAILLPRIFLPSNMFTPEGLVEILEQEATYFWSPILSETPVNTTLIRVLLNQSTNSITGVDFLRIGNIQFSVRTLASFRGLILGTDQTLLGIFGGFFPHDYIVGRPIAVEEISGLKDPYEAALAGSKDPKLLYTEYEQNNQLIIAVPVNSNLSGEEDRVVGVAVVFVDSFPTQRDVPRTILIFAGRFLLLFLFGAGLMGAVFGAMTANGLAKRFNRLATTTERWSEGDFSTFINDSTGDEVSKLAHRLDNMAEQLQSLLRRRQEMAVSEERNRLARDLHDSAKQQALAASFELGTALTLFDQDRQGAKKHLVEADNLVDSVRQELTNLVHELRPQSMEGQEFSEILKDYALDWSHRSGIELDTKINIEDEERLSLESKESLFRIAQEALANVARHSSAKHADLLLEIDAEKAILTIKDNGCGFDPKIQSTGVGLRSMRERTEEMGGSFSVESSPDHGTQIIITLPMKC